MIAILTPKNAATPMMVVASKKRMTAFTQIARFENALKRYASSFTASFGWNAQSLPYLLRRDRGERIRKGQRRRPEEIYFHCQHNQTETDENNRNTAQIRRLNKIPGIQVFISLRTNPRGPVCFHRRTYSLTNV